MDSTDACTDPYAAALLALKTDDPNARDDAIRTLMTLILPEARRTAARYRVHRLDADDLVQAIQLRVLRLAEVYEYDPERRAAALVVCVARRAAMDAAESLARQRPFGTFSLNSELFKGGNRGRNAMVADVLEDPETPRPVDAFADAHDARLALRILKDELSKLERAVWIARIIEEKSFEDILVSLNIGRKSPLTFRSVDNALQRANKKFSRLQRVQRIREDECRIN